MHKRHSPRSSRNNRGRTPSGAKFSSRHPHATASAVRYDVLLRGRALLQDCTLALDIDHQTLGLDAKVHAARKRSYDQTVEPAVRQKFARIRENYNELRLEMEGGYAVVFRAYNEGAAYRFETSLPQQQVKVYGEETKFNFPGDSIVYYPQDRKSTRLN